MIYPPSSASSADSGRSAAVLMGAQGLVLIGLAGVLVVDVVQGQVNGTGQALIESGFVLLFAAAALGLAWGLVGGSGWARTPSLVWNLLLLPVAYAMLTSSQIAMGAVVLLVSLLTLIMAWRSPRLDQEQA